MSEVSIHFKTLFLDVIKNIYLKITLFTERDGAVVTHWTRIRKVSDSNPGADQSDWDDRCGQGVTLLLLTQRARVHLRSG